MCMGKFALSNKQVNKMTILKRDKKASAKLINSQEGQRIFDHELSGLRNKPKNIVYLRHPRKDRRGNNERVKPYSRNSYVR
jgi:hypothetical protein